MELKDVLKFYLPIAVELNNGGSKVYNRIAVAVGNTDDEFTYVTLRMGTGAKSFTHSVLLSENRVKPILRPLSDMTEEEAIKLCSIYSPEAFGDYRFSKWVAVRDEENFCYNVTNKKSDFSFSVDIEEMHIKVYDGGSDTYPSIEKHTYFTEYLCMGFDLFGLINRNLAIDKTKLNP